MIVKRVVKRLLRPFNLSITVDAYGTAFRVPIMRGFGASHRQGSERWMVDVLTRLFRLAGRPALIDVGVNLGQTLLKAKSIDPQCRYAGFEPNSFCVEFVKELIALNRFEHCRLLPVALSDRAGLIELRGGNEADSAASMIAAVHDGRASSCRQAIATLVFDEVAAQFDDLASTGVVKIDVEGAELEVLTGMQSHLSRRRPLVACEVLPAFSRGQLGLAHERHARLLALLGATGYAPLRIVKDDAQRAVARLTPIAAFPDEVYDARTSPPRNDYLFVPHERMRDVVRAFAPRADSSGRRMTAPVALPTMASSSGGRHDQAAGGC